MSVSSLGWNRIPILIIANLDPKYFKPAPAAFRISIIRDKNNLPIFFFILFERNHHFNKAIDFLRAA